MLTKIKKEAIGRRSIITYKDENDNLYKLCKILDAQPPYYEAFGPFKNMKDKIIPVFKIQGKEKWGESLEWSAAKKIFIEATGQALFRWIQDGPMKWSKTHCWDEVIIEKSDDAWTVLFYPRGRWQGAGVEVLFSGKSENLARKFALKWMAIKSQEQGVRAASEKIKDERRATRLNAEISCIVEGVE
jgi:hypothetical protein